MSFEINAKITADASGFDAAISRTANKAEELNSKLTHSMDGWQEAMGGATQQVGGMEGLLGSLGGKLAAVFSIGAIANFANSMAEMGDHFQNLHLRTGISTTDLQNMAVVADQTNISLDSMVKGIERLGIAQAKAKGGDKDAEKALLGLGLTKGDIAQTDKLLDNFTKIGESVKGRAITGELEKSVKDIFGKSGTEFLQPFQSGFADKMREMDRGGVSLAPHQIEKLAELNDAKVKFMAQAKTTAASLMLETGEMFTDFFGALFSGKKAFGMIPMPGTWSQFNEERARQRERDVGRAGVGEAPDLLSAQKRAAAEEARIAAITAPTLTEDPKAKAKREHELAVKRQKDEDAERENAAKFTSDMAEARLKVSRAGMTTDAQKIKSLRDEIVEREKTGPQTFGGMTVAEFVKADRKFQLETESRKAELAKLTRGGATSGDYIADNLAKIGGYGQGASKMEQLAERTATAVEEIAKNTSVEYASEEYGF